MVSMASTLTLEVMCVSTCVHELLIFFPKNLLCWLQTPAYLLG